MAYFNSSIRFFFYFVLFFCGPLDSLSTRPSRFIHLYVVPHASLFDNNNTDGSLMHPFISLQQALNHVEQTYFLGDGMSLRRTTIHLYPTYHFIDTVRFNSAHSHLRLTTMTEKDANRFQMLFNRDEILTKASISGGTPITNWKSIGNNRYSAVVPDSVVFANQLFVNNRRVVRTRVPIDPSTYLQYASPLEDPSQARYGFHYVRGQFDYASLTDAMVVVYHSWTTSHHYIDHLIPENNTILFRNPSNSPIGTYVVQGKRRFHIENLCEALVPNTFCFINETKTLFLMTDGSYDPNQVEIITPIHEYVLVIAGQDATTPVEDMIVDNVAVQHSAWNIGPTEVADNQAASFLNSAPVYIANASRILLSALEISHTGSYGIWIKEGTTEITLINSLINDTGAGGIRIGQMNSPVPTPTISIKIMTNEISYGGNVFPSGVAVISHRASDVAIVDNSIHHHRYSGISIGWQWGYAPSFTSNVLIQGNYIYNVGQHILSDQGGIYMLGLQPGTVISGNVIKNVYSYSIYSWGIYLDEGSSGIIVSNNIVYNTAWASLFQHYGANNTIINNVFARASFKLAPHPDDDQPDGDVHIQLAENHTSWTFTRNIIYDIFPGGNHSAYKFDPKVIAPFTDNVYYNASGTHLLFGPQQIPFDQWQETGQDNGSVIADPLFIGDVNQCDFFTIRAESPAAQLGFQNLTKLSLWTPGCDFDDFDNRPRQFYSW